MILPKKEPKLVSVRVDDIPLLYEMIKSYGIIDAIDAHYPTHGNWEGVSIGHIVGIWLCYLLSECDHRLSFVEEWTEDRIELLQILSGERDLQSVSFCDDKLGEILSIFSVDEKWDKVENNINGSLLSVYKPFSASSKEGSKELTTFRLDAAPMQSYGEITEDGLLQYGYSKQHPNIGQFKVKLCSLDNELNHFAYPICHLTVSGNKSDDVLYTTIIDKTKTVLEDTPEYEKGNLYVGDNKFGSISNRYHVVQHEDYYLLPLSLVQLSKEKRLATIVERLAQEEDLEEVYRIKNKGDKEEKELVAQGFEQEIEIKHEVEYENGAKKEVKWLERRLFVKSLAYANSQSKSLDNKLAKTQKLIEDLPIQKQGKEVLTTIEAFQEKADNLLKNNKLEGLLKVEIKEIKTIRKIRKYLDRPARTEEERTFEIVCQRDEKAIEKCKEEFGWQVYATNTPKEKLSFESCVWKYRYQSNIESRFACPDTSGMI